MGKIFVFVNLAINPGWTGLTNHGIAFLTPILKKHNYEVRILQVTEEISKKEFQNKIKELNPSIVGFSSTSHQFKYLIKYSKAIENLKVLQIAGGVHPTIDPKGTLLRASVKGACIGEGEIPINNLLKNIEDKKDIFNTPGFYWNVNGKIKKNPVPQFITDLSTLDFPDYSIFEKKDLVNKRGIINMILSRGCPFNCTYCCNKVKKDIYSSDKNYFRLPSVKYSIEFLEKIIKDNPNIKRIDLEDDNLITNKPWFLKFAKEYKKRIKIPYTVLGRFENINYEIARALKKSGCIEFCVGIESGSESLRKNLLNRHYSNKLVIKKIKIIKKMRIKIYSFNIVGFPFETEKQMEETLKLNQKIKPFFGVCFFFYPYKGTKLYKLCEEKGLLKSEKEMNEITNYMTKPSIKMTKEQEKKCKYFYKKINSYLNSQKEKYFKKLPKQREKDKLGFIKYYFLKPLWQFSSILKSKSKTYKRTIGLIKEKNLIKK